MKTIRTTLVSAFTQTIRQSGFFLFFVVVDILMLQNKHTKHDMYFHSLQNRTEKFTRGWLFFLFLKLLQINFIFADNVCILSI